jgi:hypothetical protein
MEGGTIGEGSVSLVTLKSKRTQFRCLRASYVAFRHYQGPLVFEGSNVKRTYTLAFHVLKDVPLGAISVDEYEPHARDTLLNLQHGFGLRTGLIEFADKKKKRQLLPVRGNMTCEWVPSEPDTPADRERCGTADDPRRIVAVRYRFHFNAVADSIHQSRQMAFNHGRGEMAGAPVDFTLEDSVAKWDPMNECMRLAVEDNEYVMDWIKKEQAKRDRPVASNPNAGCLAQSEKLMTLPAYAWRRFTRLDQLHNNVMSYLKPMDTVSFDPENVPRGRLYENRPFANVVNAVSPQDMYYKDDCPVHARHVFGMTTAFAYHSVDNTTFKQTVCSEALDPNSYNTWADPSEDEMDIDLADMTNPRAQALSLLEPYQKRIQDYIRLMPTEIDTRTPERFPFPKLVFDIHDNVMCPAVFVLVHAPFIMGERLTPQLLKFGRARISLRETGMRLAAIAKLEKYETALQTHQGGPVHYDYEDLAKDGRKLMDENGFTTEGKPIADKQHEVVDTALADLHALARSPDLPLLFSAAYGRNQASDHHTMHMDDFLWITTQQDRLVGNEEESVLYVRERLRKTIRADIRSSMNLDFSFLDRPGRVRSLTGDTLKALEAEDKVQREEDLVSRMGIDYAMSRIDRTIPAFRDRDDFLERRMHHQCTNLMRYIRATGRHQELADPMARHAFAKDFREQTYRHWRGCLDATITILRESDNIPISLTKDEFRNYYNSVCTHDGLKLVFPNIPQYDYDATPFTACMQQLRDLFTAVHKTSPTTLNPAELLFFCCMDGFWYEFGRINPATNYIAAADTGIGKTFMARLMAMLFPPGVILSLTSVTKNAFNTNKSYDAYIMIFNEMIAAWMGAKDKANEAGVSDMVNFLKQRLTDFQTSVARAVKDPKTNEYKNEDTLASHHNVTVGFTNQNLVFLDTAVRRRFIVLFIPRNLRVPSIDPDMNMGEFFGKASEHRIQYERVRAITSLYITLSCAFKSAALPMPNTRALGTWMKRVHEVARRRGMSKLFENMNMHYITQITIKIQLYYAAWYALASPESHKFHSMPGAPDRFTADAILQLCGPNLAITKPAFIYAMGLLEPVIAPIYITRILRDILLEGIQIGSGPLRVRHMDTALQGMVQHHPEPEYLAFEGDSKRAVLTTIKGLAKDFELRIEEIELFLREACDQRMPVTKKITADMNPDDGRAFNFKSEKLDKGKSHGLVPPVIMEVDERPGQKGKKYRICLYIPYLQKLFKIKICNNPDLGAVAEKLRKTDVQNMTHAKCDYAFLANHMTLKPGTSVVMDIVKEAMECDVLEKFPLERPGVPLPPALTHYITPLHPEPIILTHPSTEKGTMAFLHTTGRRLHLKRTDQPMSRMILPDYGQPTSERANKRARDGERIHDPRSHILRNASTMTASLCDPDYTAARETVDELGLPVNPLVKLAYGDLALDEKVTLPLGFGPVAYFVSRFLSHESKADQRFLDYPVCNAKSKVDGAHKRLMGLENKEFSNDHVDIELLTGTATIGGVTFSVPAISQTAFNEYRTNAERLSERMAAPDFDWFYAPVPTVPPDVVGEEDAMDIDI